MLHNNYREDVPPLYGPVITPSRRYFRLLRDRVGSRIYLGSVYCQGCTTAHPIHLHYNDHLPRQRQAQSQWAVHQWRTATNLKNPDAVRQRTVPIVIPPRPIVLRSTHATTIPSTAPTPSPVQVGTDRRHLAPVCFF